MKDDLLLLLGVGVALYFISKQSSAALPSFMVCKYPDGTTIQVPVGNACPNDPTHGGQAYPCASSSPGAILPSGPWASC